MDSPCGKLPWCKSSLPVHHQGGLRRKTRGQNQDAQIKWFIKSVTKIQGEARGVGDKFRKLFNQGGRAALPGVPLCCMTFVCVCTFISHSVTFSLSSFPTSASLLTYGRGNIELELTTGLEDRRHPEPTDIPSRRYRSKYVLSSAVAHR